MLFKRNEHDVLLHLTDFHFHDFHRARGFFVSDYFSVDNVLPISNKVREKAVNHDHRSWLLHAHDLILLYPLPSKALSDNHNCFGPLPALCFNFPLLHQQNYEHSSRYQIKTHENLKVRSHFAILVTSGNVFHFDSRICI